MADEGFDDAALDAGRRTAIEAREKAVDSLLGHSKYSEAVVKALENPPFGSKDEEIKV